jgi:LacI family transcriptional regulator
MKPRRPTIKDVARRAGVAVSTASLVLNSKGYVSAELRRKVLRVVEELDYVPNRSARALVGKSTGNIGFIVAQEHFSKVEPFYTKVLLGTEFEARQHDYYILLTTVPFSYRANALPRFITEQSVDGVICAGRMGDRYAAELVERGIPAVVVDYGFKTVRLPVINVDNVRGGFLATEHLLSLGHRRIAFLGGDAGHPSIASRLIGYREAFRERGIVVDERLIRADEPGTGTADGYNGTRNLLRTKEPFTALFACNDAMAIGALRALKESGIHIPLNVSLVGFDNIDLCFHIDPRLTSVHVPKEELGAQALKVLLAVIEKGGTAVTNTLIDPELIVRESSGRPGRT